MTADYVVPPAQWKWFGYAGHFIAADSCRFRMAWRTDLGNGFVISLTSQHIYGDVTLDEPRKCFPK